MTILTEEGRAVLKCLAAAHRAKPDSPWAAGAAVPNGMWAGMRELVNGGLAQHHGSLVRLTHEGWELSDSLWPETAPTNKTQSLRLWTVRGSIEAVVLAAGPQEALVLANQRMNGEPESVAWLEPQPVCELSDVPVAWRDRSPHHAPHTAIDLSPHVRCRDWFSP